MFHDEDHKRANKEAKDFICELNGQGVRNNPVSLEVYIIDVDASIKAGNPDIAIIEETIRLADNDHTILLRSFAIKVQEFEVNRLNYIRVADVLNDICLLGKEIEEKIHENFRDRKDICIFNENKDYLNESYERLMHICDRKWIRPDIEIKSIEERK
jgi:hypothetical protein